MSQYFDEKKEPILNDDLELGCTSLNNWKQVQGVNLFIRTRNAFSFILHFVKTLLEKFTGLFTAEEQSNASFGEDDQIDWAYKKFRWKDLDGYICYHVLSIPEILQYVISWFTTSEFIASLVKRKLLLKDYPALRTVFASVKLGTVGVCTLVDVARCAGWAESWLPVVPRHPYRRISIMNVLASAICVEDALYFLSIGNTAGVWATVIISVCCFGINCSILFERSRSPERASIEELKQFLASSAADFLPSSIDDYLYKEAHRTSGIEKQDNPANDAENATTNTD